MNKSGAGREVEMTDHQTTSIRPARDWSKLLLEARAGGYSDTLAVTFIADNTRDLRANGDDPRMFAKGYHEMIAGWIKQENAR